MTLETATTEFPMELTDEAVARGAENLARATGGAEAMQGWWTLAQVMDAGGAAPRPRSVWRRPARSKRLRPQIRPLLAPPARKLTRTCAPHRLRFTMKGIGSHSVPEK